MKQPFPDSDLASLLSAIRPADPAALAAAKRRQTCLAKPPGSLGGLEEMGIRLAGLLGTDRPRLQAPAVLVFAADNGVVREGVSVTPPSVTRIQAVQMTRAKTGMSVLARHVGAGVRVYDVGIDAEGPLPGLVDVRIRRGTDDIALGPAMSRDEALAALRSGFDAVRDAHRDGIDVVGIGEMGIGNTSTSAAVLSALTGASPDETVGRGSGLTDAAFAHKRDVIRRALDVNRPDPADPVGVLAAVGGLDLAAMAGAFLGAALERVPAVADGYISIVAALVALRLAPAARDALFLSHASAEPGYAIAAREIGLRTPLHLDMRLGEGSGCPLLFQLLQAACAVQCDMATFDEAAINDDYLAEIRHP